MTDIDRSCSDLICGAVSEFLFIFVVLSPNFYFYLWYCFRISISICCTVSEFLFLFVVLSPNFYFYLWYCLRISISICGTLSEFLCSYKAGASARMDGPLPRYE